MDTNQRNGTETEITSKSQIKPMRFPNWRKELEEIEKEERESHLSCHTNKTIELPVLDKVEKKKGLKCTFVTPLKGTKKTFNNFSTKSNSCMKPKVDSLLKTPNACKVNQPKATSVTKSSTQRVITVQNIMYLIINTLGIGGTATVFACVDSRSKKEFAIKRVLIKNEKDCLNEVRILQHLKDCDRVIRMYYYEQSQIELNIVLEKGCSDLSRNLQQSTPLPFYQLIYFWINMLLAIEQIHSKGVVHLDLKPSNFIWTINGTLKLIDFGIAALQEDDNYAIRNVAVGSLSYISPEALISEISNSPQSPNCGKLKYKVCYKSDIWSLGCILYKMGYGETPFHGFRTMEERIAAITSPKTKIFYREDLHLPQTILNTIKKCLQFNKDLRPTINELLIDYKSYY